MRSVSTAASAAPFVGFVPSSFGFRGGVVSSFVWGSPAVLSSLSFVGEGSSAAFVVSSPSLGSVRCMVKFLPPSEVAPLGDALAAAVASGSPVCLGRASGAAAVWFAAVLPPSEVPSASPSESPSAASSRPWASWSA